MRFSLWLAALFGLVLSASARAAASSYVDERGTRHFVSGPEEIPAKYRNPAKPEPPVPPPAAAPAPATAPPPPEKPARATLFRRTEQALASFCTQEERKNCFRVPADDCARRIHAMAASCATLDPIKGFLETLPDEASATQLGVLLNTCVWMKFIAEAKAKGQAESTEQCEGLYRMLTLDHAALVAGSGTDAKPSAPVKLDRSPIEYMFAGSALACAQSMLGKQEEAAAELRVTLAGVKGQPELLAKFSRGAQTDEQLSKLRATDGYAKVAKEFGLWTALADLAALLPRKPGASSPRCGQIAAV